MTNTITIELIGSKLGPIPNSYLPVIDVVYEMHDSEASQILLLAYQNAAIKFLENHPPECNSCNAYRINKEILESIVFFKDRIALENIAKQNNE